MWVFVPADPSRERGSDYLSSDIRNTKCWIDRRLVRSTLDVEIVLLGALKLAPKTGSKS